MSEKNNLIVYCEFDDGKIADVSLELLTKGKVLATKLGVKLEALVVDKNISVANLKATLEIIAKKLFGEDREIRLRPSFFPFTEPSFEVDVSCFKCGGNGCSICKDTGWIEVLGSGQVHPNVLRDSGYDPEIYTGFAIGLGIERIAMLKYGITDIRNFYTNDLRFLNDVNRIDGGDSDASK